jgi:AraC-like DNA-binding protein
MIFDTAALPDESRFALWRSDVAPLVEAELAPGVAPTEFAFRSEFVELGHSHLGRTWQSGVGLYRYNGARLMPGAPEVFFLQTYLVGGFVGHNGLQPLTVVSGDVVLVDALHPLDVQVDMDDDILSLAIPRQSLLAVIGGRHMPVPRVMQAASATAVLLRQLLLTTWERLPVMSVADAQATESLLLGALGGVLRSDGVEGCGVDASTAADAGFASMRAFIERHLHDPELGIEALCRQFHVSRATVYRLFKSVGGVAAFMRRRRIERCHADLLAARSSDTVSVIARRWGFVSEAHFSRQYRASYGVPPSTNLEKGRQGRQ